MRRPADQCKLLLLYLLRYSSAAFASSREAIPKSTTVALSAQSKTLATASAAATTNGNTPPPFLSRPTEPILLDGHIALRVARREDILSIQRCNIATLPENYNSNFYLHHLRVWPDLALVAEHVPASRVVDDDSEDYMYEHADEDGRRIGGNLGSFFGGGYDPTSTKQCRIVGYVLGKVDQPSPLVLPTSLSNVAESEEAMKPPPLLGHVTSLAVLHPYRRRGLALQLMNQLHFHLRERYHADAVGLHVRVSNTAALKLYHNELGYSLQDVIRGYYQDGEDAYLMKKDLALLDEEWDQMFGMPTKKSEKSLSSTSWLRELAVLRQNAGGAGFASRWKRKSSHPMRLPRLIWNCNSDMERKVALSLSNRSVPSNASSSSSEQAEVPPQMDEISVTSSSSCTSEKDHEDTTTAWTKNSCHGHAVNAEIADHCSIKC